MSLNFGTINKRRIYLENTNPTYLHESVLKMNTERLTMSIGNDKNSNLTKVSPTTERYFKEFVESLSSIENPGRYLDEAVVMVSLLDEYDTEYANFVSNELISQIIPLSENNDLSRVKYRIKDNVYGTLTESQTTNIIDSIDSTLVADRIIENHKKISKRFNVESIIENVSTRGLERTVESVCNIVETYRIEPYQKLNICIEEVCYVLGKNGIDFDKRVLVKEALENIIIGNELDLHNFNGYIKALVDSYCLESEDLELVPYINDPNVEGDSISKYIDMFMVNPQKDYTSLISLCFKIAKECSVVDLKYNIDKLIFLIRKCIVMGVIDNESAESCIKSTTDQICDRGDIDPDTLQGIIDKINDCECDNRFVVPYKTEHDANAIKCIKNCIDDYMVPSLNNVKIVFYDKPNLEAIDFFSTPDSVYLNEFKIFKFNNLIKAAFNLDKYLKLKGKKFMRKPKEKTRNFIRKARNILFGESASETEAMNHLGSYLTSENIPDICVAIYEYNNESEQELKDFLSMTCKTFNESLDVNSDIRAYYIMNTNCAEVHIRENVQIIFGQDDYVEKELSFEEAYYINLFADTVDLMDKLAENKLTDVEEFVQESIATDSMSEEACKVALEAMSILNVDENLANMFIEFKKLDETYTPVTDTLVTENDKIEAFNTLASLLEAPELHKPEVGGAANYWDDDDDDEDDEDENDNTGNDSSDAANNSNADIEHNTMSPKEFAKFSKKTFGVNLSGLKMAMLGMKKKMSEMGHKERELCNDLDNASRIFVKGLKDAMISDRREAIIKGSIIPSFSKCIKIAVGLAGVAKFIDPSIAIIAAVGGFAMSKHLTHKERILLLDEIEVELDVVEKEINLAESRNQLNKYRALQKYKKDLQRQYQRIRYNVRVGKDILPGSSIGVKSLDQ